MILFWIVIIPFAGGLLAWVAGSRGPYGERKNALLARWISLASLSADLILVLCLWLGKPCAALPAGVWIADMNRSWLPGLGISFHLAMDVIRYMSHSPAFAA